MGNDTQNNEEQLEMLLMTLAEVRHGICLFQSENQAKRVALIRKRFGRKRSSRTTSRMIRKRRNGERTGFQEMGVTVECKCGYRL